MQTNTVVGTTALFSAMGISLITPISVEAIIGAFAGSMVYALSPTSLSWWKQAIFSLLAFALGVMGQASLSRYGWMNEAVSAAIISSVSIYALFALVAVSRSEHLQNGILHFIRRFTAPNNGGNKNE